MTYDCLSDRKSEPLLRWWPELEVNGLTLHNMVALGEEEDCEWFMLEFPETDQPLNPAVLRLGLRRIFVREELFASAEEDLADYVRRQAREWGAAGRHIPVAS